MTGGLQSIIAALFGLGLIFGGGSGNSNSNLLDSLHFRAPIHVTPHVTPSPSGLSPSQIKAAYNLPASGGHGTIAIIDAYDAPTSESDLGTFSAKYNLPACTTKNGCFEKHRMSSFMFTNSGWALEAALDTQWAHAVAPGAKILLVEARSDSANDLLRAVDYARGRSDVVAVSMSWGGGEFSSESLYDYHFTSSKGALFVASAGDTGAGVSWPAVSPNVMGVGGTSLQLASNGNVSSETAWSGSGGGLSQYETEPDYQTTYNVANANGLRATPDVSFDADPASGVAVYDSTRINGQRGWFTVGGTSLGAPTWAAISTIGKVSVNKLYQDGASANVSKYLRDIVLGSNGSCGTYCTADTGYDYVTGLGSPLTTSF